MNETKKYVVKCLICGRPFIMVPGVPTSNACPFCTRKAERNVVRKGDWK